MTTLVGWDVLGPAPDPAWQERLDLIAPPGRNVQSLVIYWEEGYAWQPVERWMIARVWPRYVLPTWVSRAWFNGPNPGELGWLEKDKDGNDVWQSTAPPISRRQWRFWKERQQYMEPYWVVQGTGAGHKYRRSRQEKILARLKGQPKEAPYPGQLPYAEPDERLYVLLAQEDMVRRHIMGINWLTRNGERLTEAEAKITDHMRDQLWSWMSRQAGEWAEQLSSHAYSELWENAPVAPSNVDYGQKLEAMNDQYLNEPL